MTTHDDDHAAEKKKMVSKLTELTDVAAKVYDHEVQRKRKGKAKIVYEEDDEQSEKKSFFDHVPKKIRKALRNSQRQPHFENLNGASTSSSSPSSLNLLLENYFAEYDPPNPNSQSSPSLSLTRPKLRAVSQRKSSCRIEIPTVASFPRTVRKMPWWLVKVMSKMNGEDSTLIFEKTLNVSDVTPTQSRFAMPFRGLFRNDFLTPVERSIIEEDIDNDTKGGVEVIFVDPRSEKWGVILKRWEMTSDSGNGSWSYSLTCGWNDVVKVNHLKEGDNICVWSFRCRGVLCFALVPFPLTIRQSSSSLPLQQHS